MTKPNPNLEIVIEPTRGLRFIHWQDLYPFRDLLRLLVWRDFVTKYKQTLLGPLWHVFQPVVTTLIFTVIFSHVAQLSTDGLPAPLFYLCGLLAWNYFAQTFSTTSMALVNNAALFGKVYFPRIIIPLAGVCSSFISFFIQFAMFIAVWLLYRASHPAAEFGPTWQIVTLPLILVQLAALSLGIGLWLAALTAKFRDFAVLSTFVVQLWMYVTPVIYPLATIPKQWRLVAAINPVTMPVETFRLVLLGHGSADGRLLAASIVTTALALISGIIVFQKVERTFVDVI